MVAGGDLCTVVDVAYKSLGFKEEIRCKLDEDESLAIVAVDEDCFSSQSMPDSTHVQLTIKSGSSMANSSLEKGKGQFVPTIRSGSSTDIGQRKYMEDEHICVDDLSKHLGLLLEGLQPNAFYGVFDGHCGADAAIFVRNNLLRLVFEDTDFLQMVRKDGDLFIAAEKAVKNAFLVADLSLADDCAVDSSSGTTVLIALILGRSLLVANAGDCRAVLCRRGRAVVLSRDHKPDLFPERLRIEALGGFVEDGYLNGELSVARALGDWDLKMPKGSPSPLSAEPEFHHVVLTEEDEFMIIGCDGIWDVISSEWAVNMVRKELMQHNDPESCSRKLVVEALKQNSQDNLTVVVVCFSSEPPPVIERRPPRYHYIPAESLENLRTILKSV